MAKVKEIFVAAREITGAERQAFLDRACAGDVQLRAEVEAYLQAEDQAGAFLTHPHFSGTVRPIDLLLREKPGTVVGRYKLIQLIGEGGFGSVFMAEQQTPVSRMVALKIIKLGMDTREVIARFEAERQALAMLDHPNIAKVLDAGETATGRPYFVMELVRGVPITEYCDRNKLSTPLRLDLFMAICHALQHAHQKGIIHRDIKPNNILVTLHDGRPAPKLIDFGVAKATRARLTEKTLFTEFRQLIGTPAYMSPEQAEMSGVEVDTRSDIYSLGVLLYELLTGTTPFSSKELDEAGYGEIQRIIREVDPPKPSTRLSALGDSLTAIATNRSADPRKLSLQMRGELDWIVMKALEKDRIRRYESAGEFARDVARHLEDKPVEACPPSRAYLLKKFLRRHRNPVAMAGTLAIVAFVASLAYVQSIRTEQQRTKAALKKEVKAEGEADRRRIEAERATTRANEQVVQSALAQARGGRTSLLPGRRFDALAALAAAAKINPSVAVRGQAAGCLALADIQVRNEWLGPGLGYSFSHDCTLFADEDNTNGDVIISHVPRLGSDPGPPILRLPGGVYNGFIRFSPDDRLIAISGKDRHVRVYSLDGRPVLDIPSGPAYDFTPDGTGLAVASPGGSVVIYDLRSGKQRNVVKMHAGDSMAFSGDGGRIATWSGADPSDRIISVCELATGQVSALPRQGVVMKVAWHPNGTRLAVGEDDHKVYQWDVTRIDHPIPLATLTGHTSAISDVRFNHGGDLLASTAISEGITRLWDVASGEPVLRIPIFGYLNFSSDDRLIGLAANFHRVLAVAPGRERRTFQPPPRFTVNGHYVAFSPNGSIMACGGEGVVRFWNLGDSAAYVAPLDLPIPGYDVLQVAFNPDGSGLVARTHTDLLRISITERHGVPVVRDGSVVRQLQIEPALVKLRNSSDYSDGEIQFSSDGRHIAFAKREQRPRVVNLDDPDPTSDTIFKAAPLESMWISISPDQNWVATSTWAAKAGPYVSVWDAHTGRNIADLPSFFSTHVGFSPDDKWLVTASMKGYRFWEVGTWAPRHSITLSLNTLPAVPFSSDSRILATAPRTWGVRLVDPDTGNEIVTLDDIDQEQPLKFSPDGGQLVTYSQEGNIRLWDLRRIRQELAAMGLDWAAPPLPPRTTAPIELSIAPPAR